MTSNKFNRRNSSSTGHSKPGEIFLSIDGLPARVRNIATLRGLGYSYREIGRELSVSPQAVSLMLTRHRRCLQTIKGSLELARLSARAVNVLGRHGIRTPEEGRRADIISRLGNERNCGTKTLDEIKRWIEEGTGDAPCVTAFSERSASHRLLDAEASNGPSHTGKNGRAGWKSSAASSRLTCTLG